MTAPKLKCSCGYETEYRCRVHPTRAAHIHTGRAWLCHECCAAIKDAESRGVPPAFGVIALLEKQFVLCPGCAYDEALFENAQRELDVFLKEIVPDESVRVGFE